MTEEARNTAVEALREVCITDRIAYLDALQAWWSAGDTWAETHGNRDEAFEALKRLKIAETNTQAAEQAFRSLVHRMTHCDEHFVDDPFNALRGGEVVEIDPNSDEGQALLRRLLGGDDR